MATMNASEGHFLPMNRLQDYPLIVRAAGRRLYAADGREYLDGASGGVGAANIGHGVPEVLAAIAEQSRTLCHANASLFLNRPALELADLVIEHFAPPGLERVYFVSTGTEANELCIKLARVCHLNRGEPLRHKIITRWGGYHGSSLATLAYGGRSSRRRQFDPYFFPATRIAPAYHLRHGAGLSEEEYAAVAAAALEDAIVREGPETVSCFVAEPLVNTMGACPAPAGYFQQVRAICDRYGVLLICDEVVTGFGRTGCNFGIDHWQVSPDLIACGKGISGGYSPLACAIVGARVWEALESDPSGATVVGHTHAANPLSAAIGRAVLRYILDYDLVRCSAELGRMLLARLQAVLGDHPHVGDIRGKGLHLALELVADRETLAPWPAECNMAQRAYQACMDNGLNLCPVHGDSDGLRGDSLIIKPPFTSTPAELEELVAKLTSALKQLDW